MDPLGAEDLVGASVFAALNHTVHTVIESPAPRAGDAGALHSNADYAVLIVVTGSNFDPVTYAGHIVTELYEDGDEPDASVEISKFTRRGRDAQ